MNNEESVDKVEKLKLEIDKLSVEEKAKLVFVNCRALFRHLY
jgi:hypothetical protein